MANQQKRKKDDPNCRPGSIEQQLDMCESGPLRGDAIQFSHGAPPDRIQDNFRVDMSEGGREGAEESGDEHSSGLQGDEQQELHGHAGLPGEGVPPADEVEGLPGRRHPRADRRTG